MSSSNTFANPFTLLNEEDLEQRLQSYTIYDTQWEAAGYPLETRKRVYAMMPNVETLYMRVEGFLHQDYYMRPTLKSIHLDFRLFFNENPKSSGIEFIFKDGFLDWFRVIQKQLTSESQLKELHIQFLPEVYLDLCIPNQYVVDYDKYGPIYEDEEWRVKTDRCNPSDYLFRLDKSSCDDLDAIGKALLELLKVKDWTAITLPYHFPSAAIVADLYPVATFTDDVDEEEGAQRSQEAIAYFHAEHRNKKLNQPGSW